MPKRNPSLAECPLCDGPFKKQPGREYIVISFVGTKKFKQHVINEIAGLVNGEDFASEVVKPDCGLTLHSTIEPKDREV